MKKRYLKISALALALMMSSTAANEVMAMSPDELLKAQQMQIDMQAEEIKTLKEQVKMLLELSGKNEKLIAEKADKAEVEELRVDKAVTSSKASTSVTLYGQVNRAGLWADNGDSSDAYFVDNDNSSTRMGVQAEAELGNGNSIGAKIEYELESNSSSSVNQNNKDTSADIKIRHTDLWFAGNFGKLSIGRGSTATDGTAESDLSGTTVVTYSAIADMAGGQLWYDSASSSLSGRDIGDAYDNMDGLSRRDRFRYDSPSLAGFMLSGSAVEDDAFDLAARYARNYEDAGLKVSGALGWADGGDLRSYEDQLSGSLSILHSSGFSVTLAAGTQDFDRSGKDPSFWYSKLGYQTQIFSIGKSHFSVDYGQYEDIDTSGDEAEVFSLAYVQKVDDWGSELYIAWRMHTLDSAGFDYDDITALMAGARIKF